MKTEKISPDLAQLIEKPEGSSSGTVSLDFPDNSLFDVSYTVGGSHTNRGLLWTTVRLTSINSVLSDYNEFYFDNHVKFTDDEQIISKLDSQTISIIISLLVDASYERGIEDGKREKLKQIKHVLGM